MAGSATSPTPSAHTWVQGLTAAVPPSEGTVLILPSYSVGTSDPLDMQHGFRVGRKERTGLQKPLWDSQTAVKYSLSLLSYKPLAAA